MNFRFASFVNIHRRLKLGTDENQIEQILSHRIRKYWLEIKIFLTRAKILRKNILSDTSEKFFEIFLPPKN